MCVTLHHRRSKTRGGLLNDGHLFVVAVRPGLQPRVVRARGYVPASAISSIPLCGVRSGLLVPIHQ